MALISVDEAQAMVSAGGHFRPGSPISACASSASTRTACAPDCRVRRASSAPAGVVMGQALMAAADTLLVLAFSEALGRGPAWPPFR